MYVIPHLPHPSTLLLLLLLCLGLASSQHGSFQPEGCTEDAVASLYSNTPYPPRDPAHEEDGKILHPKHEDPNLIRSTIFGGHQLPSPFRALVAGGGTGDATLALAIGLVRSGQKATILQVDPSQASLDIAQQRIQKHSHTLQHSGVRILFLKAKISDLPHRDLGGLFHYINCIGVVHHMPDPQSGLNILSNLLYSNGGINFMVYASIGRTGVYHVRKMARLLRRSNDVGDVKKGNATQMRIPTVEESRAVLQNLPSTNYFLRNTGIQQSIDLTEYGDVGLSDLIQNPCDIAMTIDQVHRSLGVANLKILTPVHPSMYRPTGSSELLAALSHLSWVERAAFAELQSGTIMFHHLWLVKHNSTVVPTERLPWTKQSIPCRADWLPDTFMTPAEMNRGLFDQEVRYETQMGGDAGADVVGDGALAGLGPTIVSHMDCRLTLLEIWKIVKKQAAWRVTWKIFLLHAEEWRVSLLKARAVHTLV